MPTRSPAQRETEGSKVGAIARGKTGNRGRGRPKGSKNKPKGLIPLGLAEDIIRSLQPVLPPGQLTYLRAVVKDGAALDTRKELDTLILLLNRNVWPALVSESNIQASDDGNPDEDELPKDRTGIYTGPIFRKDVTERLKVLNSLLTLRANLDKARERGPESPDEQPILRIFADRSIADRVGVLVGLKPSGDAGDLDGTGRSAVPVGTTPNPTPERPLALPSGQQG